MKITSFIVALLVIISQASGQNTSKKSHALDEVVYQINADKILTKKVNVSKKAFSHKEVQGFRKNGKDPIASLWMTQEIKIGKSNTNKKMRVLSVKCRLDRYDTSIFSIYLVMKFEGKDTQTKFYCLDKARWASDWATCEFQDDSYPELLSTSAFRLGYTIVITSPRYDYVTYDFYQLPRDAYYFLPSRKNNPKYRIDGGEAYVTEPPPFKYPFVISYMEVDNFY